MLKGIIFDFDGVIAESVNVKTVAFAKMYEEHGDEIVEKVVSHHLLHGGISRFEKFKFYHKEFLGIKLTEKQIMGLGEVFSKLVVQKVVDAPYVPGSLEFIKDNYKYYDLFISTGTPEDEILEIIAKKSMDIYFKSVHGSPGKKSIHVKNIMSKNGYSKDEIIFIGDADTDIQAAKENDIPILLRIHPHSNRNYEYNKLFKIKNLNNLVDVLSSNNN